MWTRAERIADADADADHLVERVGEAVEVRGATGDDDLADAERVRLGLVELERADELAGERGQPEPDSLDRLARVLVERLVLAAGAGQREVPEDGRRLGRVNVELLHDRVLERVTAPVEDARELAGAAAGDEQRGRLVTDRRR